MPFENIAVASTIQVGVIEASADGGGTAGGTVGGEIMAIFISGEKRVPLRYSTGNFWGSTFRSVRWTGGIGPPVSEQPILSVALVYSGVLQ